MTRAPLDTQHTPATAPPAAPPRPAGHGGRQASTRPTGRGGWQASSRLTGRGGREASPSPAPGGGRREPGWRWTAGLVVVAAVSGVAGWGFHRVFPGAELLLAIVPAALAPAAVAALTRRRPLWLALLLDVLLWLAGTVPLYGTLSPAVVKDVADSWHALLSTLLPARPDPELLVLVHTLVWAAATIGAETLTRTRTRIAAVLPALAVHGLALVLGVDGEGSNLPVAAALFVLVAALALLRGDHSPLWLPAGLLAASVLAALALVAAPLLPIAARPYDPREHADLPPPARVDSVSPLDRVSAWLQIPDRDLFTVKADRPLNWRLAVLDRYDGVRWTSSARFRPTGGRVPEGEWTGAADVVRQRVTLGGLPGTWLPAAERPERVTGVRGLAVDPDSGSLLAAARPPEGFAYEVTSRVPRPSKEELLAAVPVRDPALTDVPDGPQERLLRELARQAVKGAQEPIRQAYRLQNYLRTTAGYDVTAPPGHSLKGLEFFLRTTHRGTSEQFAAAFALMARTLGLPSRVVVGFRPGQAAGGVYHVRSGHVMAWAEIKFAGLGWRPFYPTPGRSGARDDHEVASSAIEESQELADELAEGGADRPGRSEPRAAERGGQDEAAGVDPWALAGALAAGAAAAYAVAVAVVPWWRRRRRRRAPEPGQRVLGAWRQACDDLGLRGEHALTAADVVSGQPEDISVHLRPLGEIANFVRYAPETGTEATVTEAAAVEAAASEAWRHSDAVRRAARARTPLPARLRDRLLLR
ncbi:DUF3488 and transglutaminase-like domain-containing protein [Nonomuraea candida]|uniref:DUF3488 and transglutaminase-like domain-containing protein n=1 Tax=Nonomuraea candida TaxID=359159 RepID=UPI0005B9EA20|nr:DUF3488 and transglutaminase-like domain-containing protein [Nonomuraea candida]